MKVGYGRTSKIDQNLDLQIDALQKAGCEKIFTDKLSGAIADRQGLNEALSFVRPNDILVVWKLDRLGRSLKNLLDIVESLNKRNIGFISLTENIDTTTNGGRLIFHIFGSLAEFERGLIRERTFSGLEAVRARGRKGGRPKIFTDQKIKVAKELFDNKKNSITNICKILHMSRSTLYRIVRVA